MGDLLKDALPFLPIVGGAIGKILDDDAQAKKDSENIALQREFAQNGIRWKVEDAKQAGISPYLAMGASGYQYSPSYVGGDSSASVFSGMGQDISRAVDATRTPSEKMDARLYQLTLDGKELDNEYKAQQILKLNQAGTGPGIPELNETIPGAFEPKPNTPEVSTRGGSEFGHVADFGLAKTPTGFRIVKSNEMANRSQDDVVQEIMWSLKNNVTPNISLKGFDSALPKPPKGFYWDWSYMGQEFRLRPNSEGNPRTMPGGPDR